MADDLTETWTIVLSAEQVRSIKAFGRQVNSAHFSADVEPPGLEITVTLASWTGPSAEAVCGGARVDLGDIKLVVERR